MKPVKSMTAVELIDELVEAGLPREWLVANDIQGLRALVRAKRNP